MQTWILLGLLFLSFIGYRGFSKLCSNVTQQSGVVGYAFYLLATGVIACTFFFCANGFHVDVTVKTLLYAACYGIICIVCAVYTLKAYLYAEVANVAVLTSACGLITTSVIGTLLFRESIDFIKILRIVIMFAAIFLVFADVKTREKPKPLRKTKRGYGFLFVILMIIAGNSASVIELKYYSTAAGVADEYSLFFFTNVFIILFVLIWLAYRYAKNKQELKAKFPAFHLKTVLPMVGETISSNINSLVSMGLISQMDVSIYTPTASAMEIISGVAASFLFREKFGICSVIAMILSVIAVIL